MKKILAVICLSALTGCADQKMVEEGGIKSVSWLEGKWASHDGSGGFVEHWSMHGDKMYGQGAMINGTDTMMTEKLTIVHDSTGLAYVVKFPNREITFRSKGQTASTEYAHLKVENYNEITFANDTNDFPKEIIYRKQNADSLYITLRGTNAGKPMEQVLRMRRI